MYEIKINNETFHPNDFTCTIRLVRTGDEVQTQDGVDHVEARKKKRAISATWQDISREEMSRLLNALLSTTYPTVTYIDPLTNIQQTRTFILQNDPSVPVKVWKNLQYYDATSIELLEKGAEW